MARKQSNFLKFTTPASWWGEKWREGLYSGNGTVGANVYGGTADEVILINDRTLTWQGRTNVVPDVSVKLKEARKRIELGDYMSAQVVLPNALQAKNFHPQPNYPLPLCALNIKFEQSGLVTNFSRSLNMENGEIAVNYMSDGTKYNRNLFVSRQNNLIVYQITKQGAIGVTAQLNLSLMHEVNTRTPDGVTAMPENVVSVIDKQFMCFSARNDDGTDYGVVARVTTNGGTVRIEEDVMHIVNANSVFVLVETFTNGNREKEIARLKTKLSTIRENYDKMLKLHNPLHTKLFNSVSVELDSTEDCNVEELMYSANSGNISPMLMEKLYKFGRYLFVAGTDNSGGTCTPTGLWNGGYKPYRAYTSNSGELEMSYLHCLAGNLSQDMENLFDYYAGFVGDYQNNAMRIFGCRGIFVPTVFAPNTGRLGSSDIFAVHFLGAGAWLSNLFYKYAKYTQNTKFLKSKLMPFMKEVEKFYSDFAVTKNDELELSPTVMPMRVGDHKKVEGRPVVAKNSQLEFLLMQDFYTNLISASNELNINKKEIKDYQEMLSKIPPKQLSSDGIYKEFVNSVISVDYTGISVGTLYDAYFSKRVDMLSSQEDIETIEKTADFKYNNSALQNSYNMSILLNVYARLGNTYKAKRTLSNIVRGATMQNLVTVDKDWRGMGICGSGVWTPIQMQSNLAITNAIQEMLLYSKDNTIYILPCLYDLEELNYSGLIAECGVVVSASIRKDKSGKILTVTLNSKTSKQIDLYLPVNVKKIIKQNKNDNTKFTTATAIEKSIKEINLVGGKGLTLNFKI